MQLSISSTSGTTIGTLVDLDYTGGSGQCSTSGERMCFFFSFYLFFCRTIL
jgi:hypothetical protein